MARHALHKHEFKILLRLLQQDPAVCVGSDRDLRRLLHGVHNFLYTRIPPRDPRSASDTGTVSFSAVDAGAKPGSAHG